MNRVQLFEGLDCQVQVELLRDVVLGPGRRCQFSHLLEREPRCPAGVEQIEPVSAGRIVLSLWRPFVARPVDQAQ